MDKDTSKALDDQGVHLGGRTLAKSQSAYDELRRRIVEMELEPGTALIEGELIELLNIGRTPVREAIQRLAAERMIVARPRQTPFVAPIRVEELAQIVEMRFVLEVPAARYAALRATAPERDNLEQANEVFHQAVSSADMQTIFDSDNEIHRLIVAGAHNSYLEDCIHRVAAFSRRVWRLSSHSVRFDDERFRGCHDEMVAAICNGDGETAAAAATEHVLMFKRRLSRLVQGKGSLRLGPLGD